MRQKRAKAYRKLMHLYSHFFGFRQPYQMLIDSETCVMAVHGKIDLVKQLGVVMQGEIKPMITQCCIHELYLQGKIAQPAVDLAKLFERRKCNHREVIPGGECLSDVVGETNKHRYVVVAQSQLLRATLRSIPAVPIVHINRSVMVLEPPSDSTLRKKALAEQELLGTSPSDVALLKACEPHVPKTAKRGPKGPNPLSVKKKKAEPLPDQGKSRATATSLQDSDDAPNLGKRKRLDDDRNEQSVTERNKKKKRRRKKTAANAVETTLKCTI